VVDRQELALQYKKTLKTCRSFFIVPALLVFIAWLTTNSRGADGAVTSASASVLLVVLGIAVLSPVVTVPALRLYSRSRRQASDKLGSPAGAMMTKTVFEFTLWEVSTLAGFVAYVLGVGWWFFAAGLVITYAGYAFSFPRWSQWEQRANEYDSGVPAHAIIST
jgi:hypothetical protein